MISSTDLKKMQYLVKHINIYHVNRKWSSRYIHIFKIKLKILTKLSHLLECYFIFMVIYVGKLGKVKLLNEQK